MIVKMKVLDEVRKTKKGKYLYVVRSGYDIFRVISVERLPESGYFLAEISRLGDENIYFIRSIESVEVE